MKPIHKLTLFVLSVALALTALHFTPAVSRSLTDTYARAQVYASQFETFSYTPVGNVGPACKIGIAFYYRGMSFYEVQTTGRLEILVLRFPFASPIAGGRLAVGVCP